MSKYTKTSVIVAKLDAVQLDAVHTMCSQSYESIRTFGIGALAAKYSESTRELGSDPYERRLLT